MLSYLFMKDFFRVSHFSKKSKARIGEINTVHGKLKTPGFIAAATKGTIKTLTPKQVNEIGIEAACFNTYHLVTHPGADIIAKVGGIHKYSGLNIFAMSDSGGFQVFSLARNQRKADVRGEEQPLLVKISGDGVRFRSLHDGQLIEFTPEKSMEYQLKIGADINMAFDECTYYPATHEYAEDAMNRTHEWLKRCVQFRARQRNFLLSGNPPRLGGESQGVKNLLSSPSTNNGQLVTSDQFLYGIIQGATFEDLRKKSAEFVVAQNTPGIAIGGVSVGESKKEMRDQVKWMADYLPKDRPVHLLGVGQIDDIIDLVKYGVDTFDCVEPTRLARMGTLYKMSNNKLQMTNKSQILNDKDLKIDITRTEYKNNFEKLDVNCNCYVCTNFTKSYLHHLFKQREILGYTLATHHNLYFMEKLFDKIRELIIKDQI